MAVSNVKKVTHSDMCAGTAGLLKGFTAEQIDQVTRGYAKYEEQIAALTAKYDAKIEALENEKLAACSFTDDQKYTIRLNAEKKSIQKDYDQKLAEATKKANEAAAYKAAPIKDTVSFEEFEKLDIRVGLVKDCQKVKKSKKLLQFTIDDGSSTDRTICSGIAAFYENPEELIGKRILFVANFAPRTMMGIESQGMILSAVDADESLSVVTTTKDVKPGSQVG